MRGPPGTTVKVGIERLGAPEMIPFTLTRRTLYSVTEHVSNTGRAMALLAQ